MVRWIALFMCAITSAWTQLEDPIDLHYEWTLSNIIQFLEYNNASLEDDQYVLVGLIKWFENRLETCKTVYEISDSDTTYEAH